MARFETLYVRKQVEDDSVRHHFLVLSPLLNLLEKSIGSWACSCPPKHSQLWDRRLANVLRCRDCLSVSPSPLYVPSDAYPETFYESWWDGVLNYSLLTHGFTSECIKSSTWTRLQPLTYIWDQLQVAEIQIGTGYSKNDKICFIRCLSVLLADFK